MQGREIFASALICALCSTALPARAEKVTYWFGGTVVSIDELETFPDPLGFPVVVGQPITGDLNYNPELNPGSTLRVDNNGTPTLRHYGGGTVDMSFSIGTGPGVGEAAEIVIGNNLTQPPHETTFIGDSGVDSFIVELEPIVSNAFPPTGPPNAFLAFVLLEDTKRAAFANTRLPATVPLPSFDLRSFEISLRVSFNPPHRYLTGTIRSFTRIGQEVKVDIRPGDVSNVIEGKKNEVFPVAVLTAEPPGSSVVFDATKINPMSVRIGGLGREAAPIRFQKTDVDGYGDRDLLFWFRSREIGFICRDKTATLRGQTLEETVVQGTDSVTLSGCG